MLKYIQEAARDAKQMEENSILGDDPLLETCTCTRYEQQYSEMCDYCQKTYTNYFENIDAGT